MIKIQEIQKEDTSFHQVLKMDQDYFDRPWNSKSWKEALSDDNYKIFTLEKDQVLCGFSVFIHVPNGDEAHLLKIFVHNDHRGRGYADALLYALGKVHSIFLEVDKNSMRAIGFYKKQGFDILDEVKNFYSDGCTAIKMIKYL